MPRRKHGGGGKPVRKWLSTRQQTVQVLRRSELNITREIEHIREHALRGEGRIVAVRALVLFCAPSGDAWILDPEDDLALCLMEGGRRRDVRIEEDATQFVIEWGGHYDLSGGVFTTVDADGIARAWPGYPVDDIRKAIRTSRLTWRH